MKLIIIKTMLFLISFYLQMKNDDYNYLIYSLQKSLLWCGSSSY